MGGNNSLAEAESSVTGRDLRMREDVESHFSQAPLELRRKISILECSPAQANAVQGGTLAQDLTNS